MPVEFNSTLEFWIAFTLGASIAVVAMAIWHLVSMRRVLEERTAQFSRSVAKRDTALAELRASHDLLYKQTNVDPLTGTANRRFLDDMLEQEWRRAVRGGTTVSLIMLDIDHFKSYNDTFGHLAGDACLKKVAAAAGDALRRPADMIARYGGEEFVILLPDTTLKGARTVAQQVAAAISDLGIPCGGASDHQVVTISAGVASTMPRAGGTLEELLNMADTLLYEAKNKGRNQMMVQAEEAAPVRPELHVIDGKKEA